MTEYLDLDIQEQKQTGVPTFLKVLCILTFVGAGIGVLSGIYSLFMNNFAIRTLESSPVFTNMGEYVTLMKKWGMLLALLNLLGAVFCLVGALVMWKLKKVGFYIYVLGQILPFIGLYGLMGGMTPNMGGIMSGFMLIGQVAGFIFPLAFIIMYGVNLKHMK